MNIEAIMQRVIARHEGLSKNVNWGERGIFYNPNNLLPLGAYMLTFKEKDGANDSASRINRSKDMFRLNLKISKPTFIELFGAVPKRPAAGCTVATGHDFTATDVIMPHPVYGWMTWIAVVNPSAETISKMEDLHLFDEAYAAAVQTFNKKTGVSTRPQVAFFKDESLVDTTNSVRSSTKKRRVDTKDESLDTVSVKRHQSTLS